MAFGLPVVGWRAGNLLHLAEHEREGLLVEPGDVEALSQAMLRLASDGELHARLGVAAKRRALRRRTWEASAAHFFAAIREVGLKGDQPSASCAHECASGDHQQGHDDQASAD
jgi:glycosyltransferase involved in cell wall biosynthesis